MYHIVFVHLIALVIILILVLLLLLVRINPLNNNIHIQFLQLSSPSRGETGGRDGGRRRGSGGPVGKRRLEDADLVGESLVPSVIIIINFVIAIVVIAAAAAAEIVVDFVLRRRGRIVRPRGRL